MSDGAFRVDPHVKMLDEAVVRRAMARGLDAIVYAPHFTHLDDVRARAERFSTEELLVVPARELFTGTWRDRKHVLAVDPDEPIPDFLSLGDTMAELDRQDATVLVPHPEFMTVSLSQSEIEAYRDTVDGVEVYNPKHLPWHNRRARRIAAETDLPVYASSYAHLPGTVGEVWTAFEDDLGSADELVGAFERDAPREVHRRHGVGHKARCAAEFAHLGWENSWEKFERVVLNGQEATHPRNPAYDGRFIEQSVY